MARHKSHSAEEKRAVQKKTAARSLLKGNISFGLVNIPVALHPVEAANELTFKLLDRRNFSPVHYQRVNEKTGQEVPWDEIIKGYEYEKGRYVAVTEEDFKSANTEATRGIEITDFVAAAAISALYYDRPYYLEPLKGGQKGYALLRDVMRRTGKIGIGKIVIRTRQHLAAVIPNGDLLVVNLLRFAHELRRPGFEAPAEKLKVSAKEIEMAERLVETLADEWNPKKYHDDYREDLLRLIERKVKAGETKTIEEQPAKAERRERAKVIDMMDLLKRSVSRAQKKEELPRRRKVS